MSNTSKIASLLQASILASLIGLSACVMPIELFETVSVEESDDHIGSFYATSIFEDNLSKELWFSPDGGCLNVTTTQEGVYSGSGALHITWDKAKGGCDWIGMGIGWENWSGKNMGQIYDRAALTFKVRTDGRPIQALPVAIGFEDYGNLQAWTGFSRKMMDSPEITSEWSTVTIPILAFNWSQFDADISNVKQLIIQFEASGDFYMDEVKIIEHQGSLRSRGEVTRFEDGLDQQSVFENMAAGQTGFKIAEHTVRLGFNESHLFVQADVVDDSPLENQNSGDKVWDGDALEIAFSSDADSSPSRSYFLSTDHQLGIRATEHSYVWDWRKKQEITAGKTMTKLTERGYSLQSVIPLTDLGIAAHEIGEIYGLEIAIDLGDATGRKTQLRWNTPDVGGFYENPSLWGEMKIVAQ